MGYGYFGGWPAYVSVAERKRNAQKKLDKFAKQGVKCQPVQIEGRGIARTFWGKAWCANLEAYSDYANRLPRGRSYVRNGSVLDLSVAQGKVQAQLLPPVGGVDQVGTQIELPGRGRRGMGRHHDPQQQGARPHRAPGLPASHAHLRSRPA